MIEMHVNLKRFDVPRSAGGICPDSCPARWIKQVLTRMIETSNYVESHVNVVFYPPESLLHPANETLAAVEVPAPISLGSQGVFREDLEPSGNFGAFTTSLTAAAALTYGCTYALIGHSEERMKLLNTMIAYDSSISNSSEAYQRATVAVNGIVNKSVACAVKAGLRVTLCVGETAQERGTGSLDEIQRRVFAVLRNQIEDLRNVIDPTTLILAYEPRWAIGPGKTPPDSEYVAATSDYLKSLSRELFGTGVPVLYGGGLKQENAESIGRIGSVDGGLIALTKFSGDLAFDPDGMARIVDRFIGRTPRGEE